MSKTVRPIMREVATLKDAEYLLREIIQSLDRWETRDIDLGQRRIVNAGPSRNPYDYVTRAELLEGGAVGGVARPRAATTVTTDDFDYCVFGIGINTDIAVADDVPPRHIVAAPFVATEGHQATLIKVYAQMKEPEDELSFRVWKNAGMPMFEMTMPAGDGSVQTLESFDEDSLEDEDYIGVDVLSVGSTAGSGLYIKLKYVWS